MNFTKMQIKDEAFTKEEFSLKLNEDGILCTCPKPKNLSHYYEFGNYISHQSDKKTNLHWIYNLVKKWMFTRKLNLIKKHHNEIHNILDFGCGTGDFIQYLKKKRFKTEGVEPTKLANHKAKEKGLKIYNCISEVRDTFDVITLFHVLEHVEDYNETLIKLKSRLGADGILVIALPNYNSYDARYYKEKWAAWDVPRHLWHFDRNSVKQLADKHNLELLQIKPMPLDAFYISMVSERYRNQSKLKGVLIGLLSNMEAWKTKQYSSLIYVLKQG